ncbi:eIF-2-alpha kinase activator GCN1 [Patella vulgata]|uniref:eIF-2-alpha kinase activator GCN1 n=1 Tax=Patella vulgata TaxID=6465 RepID=UPI0024A98689|nr:eIF-2-alpha kinase activator GCN1 [Patella vulgata]
MADSTNTGAEVLKKFAQKVGVSSTRERIEVLNELNDAIEKNEIPEVAVKGIVKFLVTTLGYYRDRRSVKAVLQVIQCLTKVYPDATVKQIVSSLTPFAEGRVRNSPLCRSASGESVVALSWTCCILSTLLASPKGVDDLILQQMVGLQITLIYNALSANNKSINKSTYRKLQTLWSQDASFTEKYAMIVQEKEPAIITICCCSLLLKYFYSIKNQEAVKKYKVPFIEIYVKQVLASRTNNQRHVLSWSIEILRHCSHDDFKSQILPTTQKAMLRNPETIMESVTEMLNGTQLDLSQYAADIGKLLHTQLISKDSNSRKFAEEGMKYLAEHCSDAGAIEKLVTKTFAVLGGSEGKLTVLEQKLSVLTAIGNIFYNTVSGTTSVHNLSVTVSELFLPTLQTEIHEGTLVHCLSMLSLWCSKFYTEVPEKLTQWFKKGITLKTATASVRNAYILCMNSAYHGDILQQANDVLPILLQTFEKANKQSSQSQLVTEAVSASLLLLRLSLIDIDVESKLAQFWSIVTNTNKQLLVNEKFLSAATDETLQSIVTLSERLILDFPQKMKDSVCKPYHKALIYCLTRNSWCVRKTAMASIKRILSLLSGTNIPLDLIAELGELIETQKVSDYQQYMKQDEEWKESNQESSRVISPKILTEALMIVGSVTKASGKEAKAIALSTLPLAHNPYIVYHNKGVWISILLKLKIDPANFIKTNLEACLKLTETGCKLTPTEENIVKTLILCSPDVYLPSLMKYVRGLLTNSTIYDVTKDGYGIFLTPEGTPYDTTLIDSAMQKEESTKNIKRQNKLYSYEEQMAEIELRKEMEKIKGKKADEPKLSKKQEEMLQMQLKEESATRAELTKLHDEVCCACTSLAAAIEGNNYSCSSQMKEILSLVTPLLQSPLSAPIASEFFLKLAKHVFEDVNLAELVGNVTLRLLDPKCPINPHWTKEPIPLQAIRAVMALVEKSISNDNDDVEEEVEEGDNDDPKLFPASTFAYIYYLLFAVLKNGGAVVSKNDDVKSLAIQLISEHAQMRTTDEDEYDPELLPREQLYQLLFQLIGTMDDKLQQDAVDAILEVARCGNGDQGATRVTPAEINEILTALQSPCMTVRDVALQCLMVLSSILPTIDDDYELGLNISKRVWIASNDVEEYIKDLAVKLKTTLKLNEPAEEICSSLVEDIIHTEEVIRIAAANTMAQVLECHPSHVSSILYQLLDLYEQKLYMPPPITDEFGRLADEQPPDMWPARSGIALTLCKIAYVLPESEVAPLFEFYVPGGLGDRNAEVRALMRDAALACVEKHGMTKVDTLLPVFENFLTTAPETQEYDAIRQSVIILMGTLTKHLNLDNNPKVKPVVAQLIAALSTPSQGVQEAVANCLPPLVAGIKTEAPALVERLLKTLLESEKYAERRGAAYGLAGFVKGLGIMSLKQQNVMTTLTEAIQDKKDPVKREGALFAFEMLCNMLGKFFEPYIVNIIQHLLLCFGDGKGFVRKAAIDCSKAVMRNLSGHGVKLILPSLLKGLEENSWRTKIGSVELLGSMSFCAPKQLSACLPSIVPKLMEILLDSHPKVQDAGYHALKQIGSVIKNPEIQVIVPTLIKALQNPTHKTTECLQKLLATKFVHFVDAPSLALIMPVIQRAFQDRSTDTRKMAAQIMGNMYSLTDQKDLTPYLPNVIPGLKNCLLDPVPEVRNVSAKALGAMVKGLGESSFEDIMPWLMDKLVAEQSSVDRSGAALGLSEVIGGMGLDKLHELMPKIIRTAEQKDLAPHVRDGYIMTFIYLPATFGSDFSIYVGPIIPSILQALADETEFVRDTALRAGQRLISLYADTAIEVLLPELEKGLFSDNWRIRYSSVQLLGDLLFKISGVTGKMTTRSTGDDDNFGTESSYKAIISALGEDRRNRVLAGLYIGRSDTALLVRQSSLHVWKIVVTNTPKTLREILPTLFTILLGCLASTSHDKRQIAGRTLGDLVRKLGERVLPEIIPILEQGLDSEQSDQRQGVCIGLSEIMASTSREHVVVFANNLIPTVRRALCDPLPSVREAAATTFDHLQQNIGQRALDEILPNLLKRLNNPELSEQALDGLKQVMAVKSKVVLPYLVPKLITPPVNTRALSLLTSVAGDALTKHLSKILPALLTSLSEKAGTPDEDQELQYCKTVVLSVKDYHGIRTIMEELLSATNNKDADSCSAAVTILHSFCSQTEADFKDYIPQLFRGLIMLFVRTEEKILIASWNCLASIVKKLDVTEMLRHIPDLRQAVRYASSDYKGKELPGFSLPKKGIAPILPIYREGILNGSTDMKEAAAVGLGEIISLSSAEALKPSVINITGPLIRILGDRFTANVKVALLETLNLLLEKVGMMLKPFLPQLQTTFAKALNDPNRIVRLRAAAALGNLIVIHTRVDPLFTELHTGLKAADDTSIKDTMLQALRFCLVGAGGKVSEALRKQIQSTLLSMLSSSEDSTRSAVAGCVGAMCTALPNDDLSDLLKSQLLDTDTSVDWKLRHGRSLALVVGLKESPNRIIEASSEAKIKDTILELTSADKISILQAGLQASSHFINYQMKQSQNITPEILSTLVKGMKHESNDIKITVTRLISYLSTDTTLPLYIRKSFVPSLVNGTKEKNTGVKANSELTLIVLLKLRENEDIYQETVDALDSGMKESLVEVYTKSLKKQATAVAPPQDEIDDTLLT